MIRKHSKSLIGLLAAILLFSNATPVFAADAETSTAPVIETVTDGNTNFTDDEFLSVSGNVASYEVAQMSLDAENDYGVELIDDTATDTEYLTVTIPASLELVTNDEGNYSAADVVSVNGNIGSNKLLQISTNTEITYTHTDDTSIKANGIVAFGTDGVEEYSSADSRPISVAVSKDDIDYIGTYGSTVYFDISLVNNAILDVYEMDDVMLTTYFTWNYDTTEETNFVTGLSETGKAASDFVIPATYDGNYNYPVTKINAYAFQNCYNIVNMTIPDSVTTIGDYAFNNCKNLKRLTLPANTTVYLTTSTYSGCSSLEEIVLTKGTGTMTTFTSSNYKYTPWYLNNSSVKTVTIEDGVANVGAYAFSNCTGLQNVIIKNDSVKIESSAFLKCTGLTSITLPASFSMNYSFANCVNLTNVTLTKGTGTMTNLTSSNYKTTPWYISRSNMNTAIIEHGVENIGNYMFYNCTGLKNVVYNDVTYTSLSELTAALEADGVTIGTNAFVNTGLSK